MDPEYEPDTLRIFHQDEQQTKYTAAYMNKVMKKTAVGEKFRKGTRTRASTLQGPSAWYEVMKQAAQSLPKLFSTPKYRKGVLPSDRDYLRVDKLWVGCNVWMIWHMDVNGIQAEDDGRRYSEVSSDWRRAALQLIGDTEGMVRCIRYNRKRGFNAFYVKGVQMDTLNKVTPSVWNYAN